VRDEFELEHERELHLIVVRRDTAVYQHLHPRKGVDGTWSVQLTLTEPGVYRAYAEGRALHNGENAAQWVRRSRSLALATAVVQPQPISR
jgi:hypothetical protein